MDSFDQLLQDSKYQSYDKTEEVEKHSFTIAATDDRDRVFQLAFGPDGNADFPVVDSQVSALELSSLAEKTYTDETLSIDFTYRQLYNFDRFPSDISTYYDLSSNGLSSYDVIVKHKNKHPLADVQEKYRDQAVADIEYVSLSCLVPPGDTNANKDGNINTYLSSVELATIDGNAFYELYGFQKKGTLDSSDLSSGGVEVVVRDSHSTGGNGSRVNYVDLSTITESLSSLAQISGDTNIENLH